MKIQFLLLTFILTFIGADAVAQKSPRMAAEGSIDGINIAIDYSAPSVKGRKIWGGLEKFDAVWRAGADKNTTVSFDKDVTIAGQTLAAGKYGFFIIPKKEGKWVAIFNKKNDGWGAYAYNKDDDALRVEISPEWLDSSQEQLSYAVEGEHIVFAWDKAKLSIPVE